MKNLKILLSLVLVFAMIASTCVVSFASSVSHISYNETTTEGVTTVESSAFVAGQSKEVKLYTAVYDADGDFVKATVSDGATTGLLKTSITKEDGQTVKSFLWDSDKTPFYIPAEEEELSAEDIKNVTITINGKPVSEYGIEILEPGGEYNVDIYEKGLDSIPYVKVESKEPTLTSSVVVDEANLKTVVTIAKGSNGQETVTKNISTTGTYDVQRYSRASEKITFNWVKSYVSDEDISAATSSSTAGWRYDVPSTLQQRTSKTVTLAEGETVKKVSVKFANFTNQQTIVIVKPADTAAASYIADPKTIVVASDGTALTWTDDGNVVADYSLSPTDEGYSAGNIRAYGKKSVATPATIAGTAKMIYWPVKAVLSNDNGYETGSRTTHERSPNLHQRQIYNLGSNTDLLGCPYIVGDNTARTDCVVTFYIADDAEIVTLSPATTVTYSVADGEYAAADSTTTNKPVTIIYTNNASAIDVAWLMKKGYIYESDINSTGTNNNKKHVLNDGTTVNPVSYNLRTWDYTTTNKITPTFGFVLADKFSKTKNLTYKDILALWKDHEFEAESEELVQNFNVPATFEGVATFRYPETLSDYNSDKYADTRKLYEDYTYSVTTGSQAVLNLPGSFPGKTAYADRTGETTAAGTGTIISYPEALGLENDYNILSVLNSVNGSRFGGIGMTASGDISMLSYSDVWRQVQGVEWVSFTVARDAKVTVLASTLHYGFVPEADKDGWTVTDLGADALTLLQVYSSNSKQPFRYAFTKHYPAGSKVTLTTPGTTQLYTTFIDEWDSGLEHSTDLAGITVDGVALDGFDADTTEYTYTVEINDMSAPVIAAATVDAGAKVKVVNPTEFPGSAKIKVTNYGEEKIYTVNYVLDSSAVYADNLVMSPSVTFTDTTRATIETNLQVGDHTYNDRLTNANMVFSAVADEYVGRTWMRGALGWPNDAATNDYKSKWVQTDIISDWVSFDICRDSTIHVVATQVNTNAKGKYMVNNGWGYGYNSAGYLVGYTASATPYSYRYTKHFEVDPATGKATVQLPNLGGTSMFAVIIPDGWTE